MVANHVEAENRITTILQRELPYKVNICGSDITIRTHNVYPPGKLSKMFASFLCEHVAVQGKKILDIGAGCSTLGIVLAQHGADKIVGVDINPYAVEEAMFNIKAHNLAHKVTILEGNITDKTFDKYHGKFDIVIAGMPWDSISSTEFRTINSDKQNIYRSFYDVDDEMIKTVMTTGFLFLNSFSHNVYITACIRIMPRVQKFAQQYNVEIQIMAEEDIHNDGNTHYILALNKL